MTGIAPNVRLDELNALSERPDFWNDPEKAQKLMRERNKLEAGMDARAALERDLRDTLELAEMAEAEGDDAPDRRSASDAEAGASARGESRT